MVDLERVANIVREVAEAVILPRFRNLKAGEVRTKTSARDFVTIADLEAERMLTGALTALLPGSCVVGEEGVAADKSQLDLLQGEAPVWVLDPVDGTANFTEGNPSFAVMVALVRQGETLAGWIHDPLGNRTAMAKKGAGAWMHGERLTVASPCPVGEMTGAFYSKSKLPRLAGAVGKRRCTGCAAAPGPSPASIAARWTRACRRSGTAWTSSRGSPASSPSMRACPSRAWSAWTSPRWPAMRFGSTSPRAWR